MAGGKSLFVGGECFSQEVACLLEFAEFLQDCREVGLTDCDVWMSGGITVFGGGEGLAEQVSGCAQSAEVSYCKREIGPLYRNFWMAVWVKFLGNGQSPFAILLCYLKPSHLIVMPPKGIGQPKAHAINRRDSCQKPIGVRQDRLQVAVRGSVLVVGRAPHLPVYRVEGLLRVPLGIREGTSETENQTMRHRLPLAIPLYQRQPNQIANRSA